MEAALPISVTSIVVAGGTALYLGNNIKALTQRVDDLEKKLAVVALELEKRDREIIDLKGEIKDSISSEVRSRLFSGITMHEHSDGCQHKHMAMPPPSIPMIPPRNTSDVPQIEEEHSRQVPPMTLSDEERLEYLTRVRRHAATARAKLQST